MTIPPSPGRWTRPRRPALDHAAYRDQLRQWRDVPLLLQDLAAAGDRRTRRLAVRLWDRLINVTEAHR